jgi:acetyl-CoA carboxylase biotin carboxyl carrier protein
VDFKELKQHLKELMAAMGRNDLKRMVIKHEGLEVELEREESFSVAPRTSHAMMETVSSNVRSLPPAAPLADQDTSVQEDEDTEVITSPMVGTFYTASSPDAAPFIKVGDTVTKDTVVCIVEAMKVMNEIKAGVTGTVTQVLLDSGDPVEFGTKLFRVR